MTLKNLFVYVFAALGTLVASAETANAPTFLKVQSGEKMYICNMSDNGLWGVSEKASTTDGSIVPAGGVLVNLTTMECTDISDALGVSGVADVTDDGRMVVGEQMSLPAYWTADTNSWVTLPLPDGCTAGRISAVTPDGSFGVGYANPDGNIYEAVPVLYDLTKKEVIELTGLPEYDMNHFKSDFHRFMSISADGRYILGEMSFIYMMPISVFSYVYDRQTGTYKVIGFTESLTSDWKPAADNVAFIESAYMSPNAQWVTGAAYMVKEVEGSEFANEYTVGYRLNLLTDEFELYDGDSDSDYAGNAITNDGLMYAYSPANNPARSAAIRHGNYYYSLSEIFRQVYGINYEETTGYDLTGLPCCVSTDGSTLLMLYYTDESYVIKLNEPIENVLDQVDLLANYTVDPANASVMTTVGSVDIRFDRNVAAIGNPNQIELRDENGTKLRNPASGGFTANKLTITLSFRTTEIPEGKTYSIYIPEGMISLEEDSKVTNKAIEIFYTGRGTNPVVMTGVYPVDGAAIAALDASSNPMILAFDANIKLSDETTLAKLYRKGENDSFCDLYTAVSGNYLQLYPLATQNLYKDTEYEVVIPAGLVTDLSGNGANEEITLHYSGAYVREISSDDIYLFQDDCSSYDQFMFYEGDHLTPASVPAEWGFTADSTPWYIVRESSTSTDMALASHSMYSPAGQSDDWLVIPQLFIPDEDCYLAFQSQSYLASKQDYLKVYVYESDDVYNTLNSSIIELMRTDGDLILNELQLPGDDPDLLDGDWRDNVLSLEKYAGKNIYIAFVNDNYDQSAIFIDNVQVVHDMKYLVSFTNQDRVINQENVQVSGVITVQSDVNTYNSITMTLTDGEGNFVDEISESGLSLVKGDTYSFVFNNPLPLGLGVENKYTVEIVMDEDKTIVNSTVRNLVFEPTKRVVVEEYSGADCSNCPLGFLAMDNLQKLFPGLVLPVVLRTYGGDTQLAVGLSGYNDFLGLASVGAPSARINRGDPAYPMIESNGEYLFTGTGIANSLTGRDEELWLDLAQQEFSSPADADVLIESAVDASGETVNLNINVRSALTLSKQSLNLFAVVVEDGVVTYQENGFRNISSDNLGDWGANGIYGGIQYVYPVIIDHCARATGGVTYNGTGGLIPSELTAGETYNAQMSVSLPQSISDINNCHVIVMLIDAGTSKVVNANITPVNGASAGINDVVADNDDSAINISVAGSVITATETGGENLSVSVYDISGMNVATDSASGNVEVDLSGRNGVFFVKAASAKGRKVAKVIIK